MQHHTPASVAATAVGVSVALQICPQKSQSPLPLPHTTDSQIHSGGWVGLWPWPPHSTSFHSILRIVHPMRPAQPALSDDFREKIKQANPSGGSVCPSSPFFRTFLFFTLGQCTAYKQMVFLLCTPNDFTWTRPLQTGLCHHAPCHYHLPGHISPTHKLQTVWELETAGTKFALQLTSTNELFFYPFPIARRQSPQGGRGRSPSIRAPAWTPVCCPEGLRW